MATKRKTSKRKTTKRAGSRKSTRSKKRGRRHLGDLITDRMREKVQSDPHAGGSSQAIKRFRKEAAVELCSEGHSQYCGKKQMKRYKDIEAAFSSFVEPVVTEKKVEQSEARAENAGCTIKTKGRTCVGADVARFKDRKGKAHTRKGCKPIPRRPGFFSCADATLKRMTSSKEAAAKRASSKGKIPVGYKKAGKSAAIKKKCVEYACGKYACKKG